MDLELEINAAENLDLPVGVNSSKVTGAIHELAQLV